jgi:hypothetical protein
MMEDAIVTLKVLLESYKNEKKNAATKEYNIYYAGAVDAISKAIKKLES